MAHFSGSAGDGLPGIPGTGRTVASIGLVCGAGAAATAMLGGPGWLAAAGAMAAGVAGAVTWRTAAYASRLAAPRDDNREARPDEPRGRGDSVATDLQLILNSLEHPLLASGHDGRVLAANPAAEEFLNNGKSGLVGRDVGQVFTQAELLDLYASAQRGASRRGQVRIARPEGFRMYEAAASPLALAAGSGVLVTLRDVTDQAQAGHVKTDFVANASHELRTPIAALRAAVETLQGPAAADAAVRDRVLGMIAGHVGRLEEMVRDLLDLSRLESPDLVVRAAPVRGSELAQRLAATFEAVCRRRSITLAFDFHPALERLRTDRTLLLLILNNLVENATKFAYEGSTVRMTGSPLAGEVEGAAGGTGENGSAAAGRAGVRFEVIDRGIGIPLNQQGRIFERYYQVDEARSGGAERRGTGLGLAIVKHAVRALGGRVAVRSMWKEGTTMTVELPGCVDLKDEAG